MILHYDGYKFIFDNKNDFNYAEGEITDEDGDWNNANYFTLKIYEGCNQSCLTAYSSKKELAEGLKKESPDFYFEKTDVDKEFKQFHPTIIIQ